LEAFEKQELAGVIIAGIEFSSKSLLRIGSRGSKGSIAFPLFLIGFASLVVLRGAGILSGAPVELAIDVSRWCLVAAIAALGMKTSFKKVFAASCRPVILMIAETAWIAGRPVVRHRSFASQEDGSNTNVLHRQLRDAATGIVRPSFSIVGRSIDSRFAIPLLTSLAAGHRALLSRSTAVHALQILKERYELDQDTGRVPLVHDGQEGGIIRNGRPKGNRGHRPKLCRRRRLCQHASSCPDMKSGFATLTPRPIPRNRWRTGEPGSTRLSASCSRS
jgi:Conserved hypothetical protein 698